MTVKEVFELRKQGKIEEAYEAIRPMYAVHQGKYTTLCMFWTANDVLKKRIGERRLDEAEKILLPATSRNVISRIPSLATVSVPRPVSKTCANFIMNETLGGKPRMSARLPALFRDDLLIFRGE